MNFSKTLYFSFLLFITLSGCHSEAGKSKKIISDSSEYSLRPPGVISDADFRKYYSGIKDFYETTLVNHGFNGGILVAKKGRVIFEDYRGYFDFDKKDTLTAHSSFHIASVSKTFTAMAILKLAELGKLAIDDPIKKYFPALPYDSITIKSLLSHRSGLPNYTHFMDNLGWDRNVFCSNQDVIDYLVKYHPLGTGKPNAHFSYCNTNYLLLAMIIEKVTNQPYGDFLKEVFFKPLQMNDTYVFNMLTDSASAMASFDWKEKRIPVTFLETNYGDKNIYSTPRDLLKWDQALYGNQLFSKETLEAAFTPYSNEKPGVRNYGLGWRMNVYPDGRKVIYHNGWWHGNNSVFIRMIQDSVTIIVLGNKYNKYIYKSKEIADVFGSGLTIEGD